MSHSDLDYGPVRDAAEDRALYDLVNIAFRPSAAADDPKGWERYQTRADSGDLRVVRRGGQVVGGLRAIPMAHFFGGRAVPCVGLSGVTVAPEHRSRGLAAAMMRRHVLEARAQGVPLASLYPASDALYGRAGYERAGHYLHHRVRPGALTGARRELEVRRATEADQPAIHALYATYARHRDGHVDRDARWWRFWVEGFFPTPLRTYLALAPDGAPEGYVSLVQTATDGHPYDVVVRDVAATSARAWRSLAAFLAAHSTMAGHVVFRGGFDHPLVQLTREQDVTITQRLDWMLRVLDVPAALTARGYPPISGALDLAVTDDLVADNAGPFRLTLDAGHPTVTPGGDGRLRLDVRALASLYSGYASPFTLASFGQLDGDPESLALARAVFAGQPSLADMF